MRILVVVATIVSCACANTAQNLPRIEGAPAQALSKRANAANGSLKPFESERALRRALGDVRRLREVHRKKDLERRKKECLEWSKSLPQPIDCSKGLVEETVTVTAAAARTDEDTNRQHEGIDEGGLVKKAGDLLVVLRRGRLFTIDTSGAQLAAIDMADLATKDSQKDDSYDWYDELLITDRTVIVIGYSNSRGGTEVVLFNLREGGRLEHRATYNLRSDDYRHLSLQNAGVLDASATVEEDNCRVSCVDWYGNASAIFSGARVFALMVMKWSKVALVLTATSPKRSD